MFAIASAKSRTRRTIEHSGSGGIAAQPPSPESEDDAQQPQQQSPNNQSETPTASKKWTEESLKGLKTKN